MKTFIQALVVVTLTIAVYSDVPVGEIDKNGFKYLGKKFGIMAKDLYMSPSAKSHYAAASDCRKIYNGQLVFLLTAAHDLELSDLLQQEGNRFTVHIGASRAGSGYAWFWDSGTEAIPMTFNRWRAGEPSNANHCACAGGMGNLYGWQGCVCDSAYRFVCEV